MGKRTTEEINAIKAAMGTTQQPVLAVDWEQQSNQDKLHITTDCVGDIELQIIEGDDTRCSTPCGIAQILVRQFYFARSPNDILHVYQRGVYHPCGRQFIHEVLPPLLLSRGLSSKLKRTTVEDVCYLVANTSTSLVAIPSIRFINLLNGIYDLESQRLYKHTPRLKTNIQLPIMYDPKASCPHWDAFVESIFPADTTELAYEIFAWLMVPYTGIKKLIMLLGDGNNGKSIFLYGLQHFLGERNYSLTTLFDLASDKFAAATILGKLANICGEISSSKLPSTDKIKSLTGGDRIEGERKFGDRFNFLPFARHIYSLNELMRTKDTSPAYYNRFLIVPFPNRFEENLAVGDALKRNLTSATELSGMFNKALAVLPKVLSKGLLKSHSMMEALDEYKALDIDVVSFLRKHCIEVRSIDNVATIMMFKQLYEAYLLFCKANGTTPINKVHFGREVSEHRPQWKQKRLAKGDRYYMEIQLTGMEKLKAKVQAAQTA